MDRGYLSPGVEIIRNEEVTVPNTVGQVIYGIVGATTKGEYGYTEVNSIKKLHDLYGYAYLGTDDKGNRVISDAIIAAERVLTYADKIVFTRVALSDTENAKFVRQSDDMLQYTIANKDATIKSVTVHHDGANCTVTVDRYNPEGSSVKTQLCSVTTEEDLKKALEYEGTLINVTVPEGYFDRIAPTEVSSDVEPTTPEGLDGEGSSAEATTVAEVEYHDVITDKYENPKGRLPHSKHMVEILVGHAP